MGQAVVPNEILAPEAVRDIEHVITAVSWLNNETVVSVWMNRIQNQAYLQTCTGSNCNMVNVQLQ